MNSRFEVALRLILPLPFRCATVDFFGIDLVDFFRDDFLVEDFADLVVPVFDVEEALFDDARVDEARPPFCAMASHGSMSRTSSTMAIRVRIANLLFEGCII